MDDCSLETKQLTQNRSNVKRQRVPSFAKTTFCISQKGLIQCATYARDKPTHA